MTVDHSETERGTRMSRWLLLVAGLVVVLVATGVWFLRQPVLTEGSFQDFPGSQDQGGAVPQPLAYDQSEGGDVTYTLTAKNEGSTSVTLLSAVVQAGPFTASSVDLPTGAELAPGAEARLVVHGTLAPCTAGQSPFTTPVPGVEVTFRQLVIQRTQVITTSGHAVIHSC